MIYLILFDRLCVFWSLFLSFVHSFRFNSLIYSGTFYVCYRNLTLTCHITLYVHVAESTGDERFVSRVVQGSASCELHYLLYSFRRRPAATLVRSYFILGSMSNKLHFLRWKDLFGWRPRLYYILTNRFHHFIARSSELPGWRRK